VVIATTPKAQRSEFSANSDLAALNQLNKAEALDRQGDARNMLVSGESNNKKETTEDKGKLRHSRVKDG
jgi:hypothetical protein